MYSSRTYASWSSGSMKILWQVQEYTQNTSITYSRDGRVKNVYSILRLFLGVACTNMHVSGFLLYTSLRAITHTCTTVPQRYLFPSTHNIVHVPTKYKASVCTVELMTLPSFGWSFQSPWRSHQTQSFCWSHSPADHSAVEWSAASYHCVWGHNAVMQ